MKLVKQHRLASIVFCCFAIAIQAAYSQENTTLFSNGDILTMNDAAPVVDAIAIRNGEIIAVGDFDNVRATAGKQVVMRDLAGKTLLPGLIDAHGHFGSGAFRTMTVDLQPPPAGNVSDLKGLTDALQAWHQDNTEATWIIGIGYDDSLLAEARHPTREDLDTVSPDIPIMLLHVSGHLLTCNTPCLKTSGITPDSANPPGGVIRRIKGSNVPDGVLEETAMQAVFAKMPRPTLLQSVRALQDYQIYYASHGITTAQEGAASTENIATLRHMAENRQLKLDIVAYQAVRSAANFDGTAATNQRYENRFRIGGIKLFLDGSPQGKTAWLTQPYHVVPEGNPQDYAGYPTMDTQELNTILRNAYRRNTQVIAHANGDAAADQLLMGVRQANDALGRADRRTVMIHAQTARDDQISLMQEAGVIPSYFVAHTFFWGDWHRDSVLGPERAARISPLNSTLTNDIVFTIHNDAPVVPPDMLRLVWTAVNRKTRSGKTLGEAERITPLEALKAITISAAFQYFEEHRKGSLEVGKLADLTILSANPTTVPPGEIKDIRVLETLKEGETIFAAEISP